MTHSDLQLRALGLRPVTDIPNRDGYKFIGRTRDGRDIPCTVAQNSLTRLCSVAEFDQLVGWRPLP